MEEIEIKETFDVLPEAIYQAWLDSKKHSNMTGGDASCSNQEGASFTAWDGYITGTNVELIENKKIVQSWRTSEFLKTDEDSLLTIELKKISDGTELTLTHKNIPKGQTQYKQGWIDHYFTPMKEYFSQIKK